MCPEVSEIDILMSLSFITLDVWKTMPFWTGNQRPGGMSQSLSNATRYVFREINCRRCPLIRSP